jgi:hypothetical protein
MYLIIIRKLFINFLIEIVERKNHVLKIWKAFKNVHNNQINKNLNRLIRAVAVLADMWYPASCARSKTPIPTEIPAALITEEYKVNIVLFSITTNVLILF